MAFTHLDPESAEYQALLHHDEANDYYADEPDFTDCAGCGTTLVGEPFTANSTYYRCRACGLSFTESK